MFAQEKPYLKSLPQDQYKVAIHRKATLSRDCHLVFEQNYYSAPHKYRGKDLDIWATATMVEIYFEAERLAVHVRRKGRSQFATDTSHYPPEQQAYAEEDLQKVFRRAERVGLECEKLIKDLLGGAYPLKHFRRSQGILALAIKYGSIALERACQLANLYEVKNIHYIERVIKTRGTTNTSMEHKVSVRAENPFLRGIDNIH